jgi:hypothetical protein
LNGRYRSGSLSHRIGRRKTPNIKQSLSIISRHSTPSISPAAIPSDSNSGRPCKFQRSKQTSPP